MLEGQDFGMAEGEGALAGRNYGLLADIPLRLSV